MKIEPFNPWIEKINPTMDPSSKNHTHVGINIKDASKRNLEDIRANLSKFNGKTFFIFYHTTPKDYNVIELDNLDEFEAAVKYADDNGFDPFAEMRKTVKDLPNAIAFNLGIADLFVYFPIEGNEEAIKEAKIYER